MVDRGWCAPPDGLPLFNDGLRAATVHAAVAIRIGKDTFEVAVDPATHTLYTASQDDTASVIVPARENG